MRLEQKYKAKTEEKLKIEDIEQHMRMEWKKNPINEYTWLFFCSRRMRKKMQPNIVCAMCMHHKLSCCRCFCNWRLNETKAEETNFENRNWRERERETGKLSIIHIPAEFLDPRQCLNWTECSKPSMSERIKCQSGWAGCNSTQCNKWTSPIIYMFHDHSNNFQFDQTQTRTQSHPLSLYFWDLFSPSAKLLQKPALRILTKIVCKSQSRSSFPFHVSVLSLRFRIDSELFCVCCLCWWCWYCFSKYHGCTSKSICIPFNHRWTVSLSHNFDWTLSFLTVLHTSCCLYVF